MTPAKDSGLEHVLYTATVLKDTRQSEYPEIRYPPSQSEVPGADLRFIFFNKVFVNNKVKKVKIKKNTLLITRYLDFLNPNKFVSLKHS